MHKTSRKRRPRFGSNVSPQGTHAGYLQAFYADKFLERLTLVQIPGQYIAKLDHIDCIPYVLQGIYLVTKIHFRPSDETRTWSGSCYTWIKAVPQQDE
jgi:hypothetical protein